MQIRIPKGYDEPLRRLSAMSGQQRHRLVAAIRNSEAVLDPDGLIQQVKAQVSIDEKTVESIVWLLISMVRAAEGSPDTFAREVVRAAKESLSLKDADSAAFEKDLIQLLTSNESLGVTAKVAVLRGEFGRVFCDGRILTDIRPVFGADASMAPRAAAIVHTLRITYHEGDAHNEFFVALDTDDLRQLRSLIDRAIKKEASLVAEVKKTTMRILNAEEK